MPQCCMCRNRCVPTAEHGIGLAPQLVSERERDAERIAAIEHAATAPEREHRRL